jgi:hypothetical protein
MTALRMIAIPTKLANIVRTTMKSPGYGHPAHKELATGYGPCRLCLRTFHIGQEERILFTYDPFHEVARYPLPGPILIHAANCERFDEHAGFPEDLRLHSLTLVAYGAERTVLAKNYVTDGSVEDAARRFFDDRQVRFLHIRDTVAGCYDFRIERADIFPDASAPSE